MFTFDVKSQVNLLMKRYRSGGKPLVLRELTDCCLNNCMGKCDFGDEIIDTLS